MGLVMGGADLDRMAKEMADHEQGASAVADLQTLFKLSEATPGAGRLVFDPTLARGLGYYTGCIFEVRVPDLGSSLGGGGRYDGLVGMFSGKELPACGFSIGLDRLLFIMDQRGLFPTGLGAPDALVAAIDKGKEEQVLRVAYQLRQEGLRVEMAPKTEKAGKVRKAADERGIETVVLVRKEPDQVNVWRRSEPKVTDRMVALSDLASALR